MEKHLSAVKETITISYYESFNKEITHVFSEKIK